VPADRGLLVVHVPKTGGISLRNAVESLFPPDRRLGVYTVAEFDAVPDERLARAAVVSSHMRARHRERLFRVSRLEWTEGVFLRHPIDHLVSHALFIRRMPEHPLHRHLSSMPLPMILHSSEPFHGLRTGDLMPAFQGWFLRQAYTGTETSIGAALTDAIADRVSFVGVTEHLLAGYLHLCWLTGLTPVEPFPWVNRAPPVDESLLADVDALRQHPLALERTAADLAAHARARERSAASFVRMLDALELPAIAPDNQSVALRYSTIAAALSRTV
jgi:hypothetical protein